MDPDAVDDQGADTEETMAERYRRRLLKALEKEGFREWAKGRSAGEVAQRVAEAVAEASNSNSGGKAEGVRHREENDILERLRDAGVEVGSLDELRNRPRLGHAAISVLVDALPRVRSSELTNRLARLLARREAKGTAARPLVVAFRKLRHDDSGAKWAVGYALAIVADDSVFEDIAALVTDRSQGKSREMLAESLGNMRDPRVVAVLSGLLTDDEISGHALVALRKLKLPSTRTYILPFVDHPVPWIRNEARKAIRAIDGTSTNHR